MGFTNRLKNTIAGALLGALFTDTAMILATGHETLFITITGALVGAVGVNFLPG